MKQTNLFDEIIGDIGGSMERLTVPAERLPDGGTRMQIIDARKVKEHAMELYWRLKEYEGTGLSPEDVTDLMASHAMAIGELAKMPKWIPVTERLPEEHDSIFERFYGTDRWTSTMFRKASNDVIVCVEYEDGTKAVKTERTRDGKWAIGGIVQAKVTHWMPLPQMPSKTQVNK